MRGKIVYTNPWMVNHRCVRDALCTTLKIEGEGEMCVCLPLCQCCIHVQSCTRTPVLRKLCCRSAPELPLVKA